jgi:hypothetical protein
MVDETDPKDPPADKPEDDTPDPSATDDVDALRKALAKANDDAKKHRLRNKELEPLAARAKELEEAGKTEQQKLSEKLADAEKAGASTAGELLKLRVALRKGLTEKQAARLVGATEEELEADADELVATFGGNSTTPPPGRPRERMRGGSDPGAEPDETDPRKLAALIPRY